MLSQKAGGVLSDLRKSKRWSQADLADRAGVSQRHLSCIETGKAKPSQVVVDALLDTLDADLQVRNAAYLAYGWLPKFSAHALDDQHLEPVRSVMTQLLSQHEPYPALVLDHHWNVLNYNRALPLLLGLLGRQLDDLDAQPNLVDWMLAPGGLSDLIVNRDEMVALVLRRLQREAALMESVKARWLTYKPLLSAHSSACNHSDSPVAVTRFKSPAHGELAFVSTLTTFGAPLDITVESLRVELLFPADEQTRQVLHQQFSHHLGA